MLIARILYSRSFQTNEVKLDELKCKTILYYHHGSTALCAASSGVPGFEHSL